MEKNQIKPLEQTVFPSTEPSVFAEHVEDTYGGAHRYRFRDCGGFKDGQTVYGESSQWIQFVQKQEDGTVILGAQSEQLVIALIDRQKKLNAKYPSPYSEKAIKGLEMFLEAQRERVEERMQRGVMGDLKK